MLLAPPRQDEAGAGAGADHRSTTDPPVASSDSASEVASRLAGIRLDSAFDEVATSSGELPNIRLGEDKAPSENPSSEVPRRPTAAGRGDDVENSAQPAPPLLASQNAESPSLSAATVTAMVGSPVISDKELEQRSQVPFFLFLVRLGGTWPVSRRMAWHLPCLSPCLPSSPCISQTRLLLSFFDTQVRLQAMSDLNRELERRQVREQELWRDAQVRCVPLDLTQNLSPGYMHATQAATSFALTSTSIFTSLHSLAASIYLTDLRSCPLYHPFSTFSCGQSSGETVVEPL